MEFQPFRGCCEIFMDYHYFSPEIGQAVIDELGIRWVEPARILAEKVQEGLLLERYEQKREVMAQVAEVVKNKKPVLKSPIPQRKIEEAEALFRRVGIFPRIRGEKDYNPRLARREFLKPYKSSSLTP